MAGFSVDIQANLSNFNDIENKLKSLENKKIELDFDVSGLEQKIKNELKGKTFKIDISGIESAKKVLSGTSGDFSKDVQAGFQKINLTAADTAGRIREITDALGKIDSNGTRVKRAVDSIEKMGGTIKSVSANLSGNKLRISADVVDSAKNVVSIYEELDDTGKSLKKNDGLKLKFDTGEAAAKRAKKVYSDYLDTIKQIGNVDKDIEKAKALNDKPAEKAAHFRKAGLLANAKIQKTELGSNLPDEWKDEIKRAKEAAKYSSDQVKNEYARKAAVAATKKEDEAAAKNTRENYEKYLKSIDDIGKEKANLAKMDIQDLRISEQKKKIADLEADSKKYLSEIENDLTEDMKSEVDVRKRKAESAESIAISEKENKLFKQSIKERESGYKKLGALERDIQSVEGKVREGELLGSDTKKLESDREWLASYKKEYTELLDSLDSKRKKPRDSDHFESISKQANKDADEKAFDELSKKLSKAKDDFKDVDKDGAVFSSTEEKVKSLSNALDKMKVSPFGSPEYKKASDDFVSGIKEANTELKNSEIAASNIRKQQNETNAERKKRLREEENYKKRASKLISEGDVKADATIAIREYEKYAGAIQKASEKGRESYLSKYIDDDFLADIDKVEKALSFGTENLDVGAFKEYESALNRINNTYKTIRAESKGAMSVFQIDSSISGMDSYLKDNSKAVKEYGDEINKLKKRLADLREEADKPWARAEYDDVMGEYSALQKKIKAEGKSGKTWFDSLGGAFESISRYVSVAEMMDLAAEAVREMYQNVVEIDTAMTELKKVTDETDASYEKFLDNAGSKAVQLGTTVTGLINSTAGFARLGFSMEESADLAEVANIYAVVGDEINGVEDATASIVSTMTAFNVNTEDAISIVDKFNKIGNEYQISSGGIGEALQRSASSMAAANNTLDESIALIAAANTVVNDPSSVGTAFKTKFLTDCLYVQKCA